MLNKSKIKYYLSKEWPDLEIELFDKVSSTNTIAKEYSQLYPSKAKLFIAKEQSQGRGRYGKSFYSQIENGIYMTLAIPAGRITLENMPIITIAAASALALAIDSILNLRVEIKWVNDLFFQGAKVAGILSETVKSRHRNEVESVIVGVGLNVSGKFDQAQEEVKEVAGTLFPNKVPAKIDLNLLVADFVLNMNQYLDRIEEKEFLNDYTSRMMGINQMVRYQDQKGWQKAKLLGINDKGHLLVENSRGQIESLYGQEIHLSSSQFRRK